LIVKAIAILAAAKRARLVLVGELIRRQTSKVR
jgi:hypothetical protein